MSDTKKLLERVARAGEAARGQLLRERNGQGWWEGELSSSALSTAVAVLALGSAQGEEDAGWIEGGLRWLEATQLPDGGWGDTVRSKANVATTLLGWAAFGLAGRNSQKLPASGDFSETVRRAEDWIRRTAGSLNPGALSAALAIRYGKDKTFAVPILMACAIGGRLGEAPGCWRWVPALPFELAALPREWFAALRLPVVSYALPALIAIGQVRHCHAPVRGPWAWVRNRALGRTRRLLREIQPEGGGFLEATPLTGFVTMALCSAGAAGAAGAASSVDSDRDPDAAAVVRESVGFLKRSVRPDGSWPIDTNLATWGTTLSVKAMGADFPEEAREAVRGWLLGQQYQVKHPYCLSAPGGWAWTDLPGGVPDADDTAGAMLALAELSGGRDASAAAEAGARWLAGLQNRDGGMPTFCKGWGALPFDRSAPDLTAHALAAWQGWRGRMEFEPQLAMDRAVAWLAKTQGADGAWLPLWFGNEHQADEGNPVYGTATVLKYLIHLPCGEFPLLVGLRKRAVGFLESAQLAEGGWGGGLGGGPASLEETAVALEALMAADDGMAGPIAGEPILRGIAALLQLSGEGTTFPAAPIGLYFARLWYYEKLYPRIATVAAFRQAARWLVARI